MADLTTQAGAISSSDINASFKKEFAFDDDPVSRWASGEVKPGIANVSFIGNDLAVPAIIDDVRIKQSSFSSAQRILAANGIAIQFSDDGVAWTTSDTITAPDDTILNTFPVSETGAHRFWRIFALAEVSGVDGNAWSINTLEIHGEFSDGATDLTTEAGAISSSDDSPTFPKELAFDRNDGSRWRSGETKPGIANVSFIGNELASPATVKLVQIAQSSIATNEFIIAADGIAIQFSDDGVDWTTSNTITAPNNADKNTFSVSETNAHKFWRIFALAEVQGPDTSRWSINTLAIIGEIDGGGGGGFSLTVFGRRGRRRGRRL